MIVPGLWFVAPLVVAAALTSAQVSAPPVLPTAAPAPPIITFDLSKYRDRLASLDPSVPLAYFELAEELAAEERTPEGRLLARRLYVLALLGPTHIEPASTTVGRPTAPGWLGSSACLGLAALAETEQDRRWLAALAGTLAPGDLIQAVQRQTEAAKRNPAALELASAIGMVRSGDGRRAAKLLDKPAVAALLSRYEGLMSPGGLGGGGERIRSLAFKHPACSECRNRRSIKSAEGVRLCPICLGRPGPNITIEETVGQLRLESMLLSGVQRSWAAQAVADGGAPMRELDPEVLVDVYGVDPTRVYWRSGAWVVAPDAAPNISPAATPSTDAPPEPESQVPASP